ncbi:MAG: TatD family hydrolase [Opitutaceae bacterium]|nr:TatD family hydrolase [Opitutaceae bacterium]
MRIIDAHVHFYPPEVGRDPAAWATARGEARWAALCTRRRRDGRPVQTYPDLDRLLRDMDAAGVEKAVLLGWYWEQPATCAWQNRVYAQCVQAHPDRLAAFATIHPAAGEAAVRAEILRAQQEGLLGLGELSPHSQGYALDDPVLTGALALAGELSLPVNLHAADPNAGRYPGRVETPLEDFVRLAKAHRRVTFILAHWGGGLPAWEANPTVRHDLANVVYDTAASPLTYDDRIWRTTLDLVPREKVLFGSDYPLILYPKIEVEPGWTRLLGEVDHTGLTPEEKELVLAGNAARVLGL